MIIVAFIEVVVCALIIRWLLGKKTGEKFSRKTVFKIAALGAASTIVALGIGLFIPWNVFFVNHNPVLVGFFVALTSAGILEEAVKYIAFRLALRGNDEAHCRLDAVLISALVAMMFTMVENVEYSIFGDASTLLRTIFPVHFLFGTVMGYYYGKAKTKNNAAYHVMSFGVPVLLHTAFDMWMIGLVSILGDVHKAANELTDDEIMALPYADYLEPMAIAAVITI